MIAYSSGTSEGSRPWSRVVVQAAVLKPSSSARPAVPKGSTTADSEELLREKRTSDNVFSPEGCVLAASKRNWNTRPAGFPPFLEVNSTRMWNGSLSLVGTVDAR
jgi:hypothetical protein